MTITATIPTAIGLFQAQADDKGLCKLVFPHSPKQDSHFQATENLYTEHPILKQTYCQLTEYLQGNANTLTCHCPLREHPFSKKSGNCFVKSPTGEPAVMDNLHNSSAASTRPGLSAEWHMPTLFP